ncbi:MAG TPA: glycosyl hydrolase family 8 [Acidimicrobiales bacterium]|nr:glycosyl hydrolase family 8 [Acidimicrobiales bacterium]
MSRARAGGVLVVAAVAAGATVGVTRPWQASAPKSVTPAVGAPVGAANVADASDASDAVAAAGNYFLDHYEQPGGRVVRWDQGGDTVSEGQAYAMLVAVALGRRDRFAAAWSWSQAHLQRADGLLAWQYTGASAAAGGPASGTSPATDADLDSAWALALAAGRFGDPGYRSAAAHLASAVLAHEVESMDGEQVLLAGPWAGGASATIDPSYLSPLDEDSLAQLTQDTTWRQVAQTSDRLLAELTGSGNLPSDWAIVVPGGDAHPTAPPGKSGSPVLYGYDAVRVPVRLAASCDSTDAALAAGMWRVLQRDVDTRRPLVELDLGGSPQAGATDAPVGMVGAAAAAAAAGQQKSATDLLDGAQFANGKQPTYYGSAWVALGRILLETRSLGGCPPLWPGVSSRARG